MRELEEIIRKYFSKDNDAIVYFDLEQELFNKVISNLKEYERPDILSIFDNKIVAIEHFEFDSYKRSRKGSEFQIENNIMERNFDKEINEKLKTQKDVVVHGRIKSTSSADNYFNNFKKNFLSHYEKIDSYVEHIKSDYPNTDNITFCFFAEDVTPLGSYFMNRKTSYHPYLLNPLYLDEIVDILINSPRVKYLIIGCYAMSKYKLLIFENKKEVFEKYKRERPKFDKENFMSFEPHTTGFATKITKEEIEREMKNE